MSYSVCLKCAEMVPMYEKYCSACLKRDPSLKQVANYWNTNLPDGMTEDKEKP